MSIIFLKLQIGSMILLTLPIVYPVVVRLGFDPIWFGVILTIMIEVGLLTPPVGMNVFIIAGMATDIPMYDIFKGITPFVITMLVLVALLMVFPQIALFLPNTMMAAR
jgi:TRAP-type C4-dicarboxylate transport system permease large subunit